jgi:hypothetical protein
MFWWLVAVAVFVLIWGLLWKSNLMLSFGVLIGLLLAWIVSRLITPIVTGMEEVPIWLPPLPLATVALVLFVYGAIVWFRGSDALPQPKKKADDEHHH